MPDTKPTIDLPEIATKESSSNYPPRKDYTEEDKIQALIAVIEHGGNVSWASRTLGIPYPTLLQWVNSKWGEDKLAELNIRVKRRIVNKAQTIVDALLDKLNKGVENLKLDGHFICDEKTVRVLESRLKEVALTVAILVDKIQLMQGQPTAIHGVGGRIEIDVRGKAIKDLEEACKELNMPVEKFLEITQGNGNH